MIHSPPINSTVNASLNAFCVKRERTINVLKNLRNRQIPSLSNSVVFMAVKFSLFRSDRLSWAEISISFWRFMFCVNWRFTRFPPSKCDSQLSRWFENLRQLAKGFPHRFHKIIFSAFLLSWWSMLTKLVWIRKKAYPVVLFGTSVCLRIHNKVYSHSSSIREHLFPLTVAKVCSLSFPSHSRGPPWRVSGFSFQLSHFPKLPQLTKLWSTEKGKSRKSATSEDQRKYLKLESARKFKNTSDNLWDMRRKLSHYSKTVSILWAWTQRIAIDRTGLQKKCRHLIEPCVLNDLHLAFVVPVRFRLKKPMDMIRAQEFVRNVAKNLNIDPDRLVIEKSQFYDGPRVSCLASDTSIVFACFTFCVLCILFFCPYGLALEHLASNRHPANLENMLDLLEKISWGGWGC